MTKNVPKEVGKRANPTIFLNKLVDDLKQLSPDFIKSLSLSKGRNPACLIVSATKPDSYNVGDLVQMLKGDYGAKKVIQDQIEYYIAEDGEHSYMLIPSESEESFSLYVREMNNAPYDVQQ